jgi:hypothetical protein
MTENQEKQPHPTSRSSSHSQMAILVLVLLLVVAALTVGVGLNTVSSGTSYGCMTISQKGSTVQVVTSGILHESSSQYYISCAQGDTNPTGPTTVSCLSINPKIVTDTYPDAQSSVWYYLSAPGHTFVVPPPSTNSSEVLLTASEVTVSVNC